MENNDNNKRAREDFEYFESDTNSFPCSKLARVDSTDLTHVESKRIQEDLLNFLDVSDPFIGPEPEIQGLDSVLKSFEEEILVPAQTRESGESGPDLGFLFGASDDELGLPPSSSSVEPGKQFGTVDDVGEMMRYELPSSGYESFELGISGDSIAENDNIRSGPSGGDFVTLGGLFEPDCGNFEAYVVT